MIALMFGGCFGVVVTCCMVTAKRSDQELGDMIKEKRELRDFLNDVRQASYSIRNHIERNFGAKEQEYITDEFAIGDPVKIPETKDEKPSEKASGKEKKAKSQPER